MIEKHRLNDVIEAPDNPYHIALMHCMLSLYDFLVEKGEQQHLTHVVVEKRGAKEDKELELEFRRICDGNNPRALQMPFEILFSDKKAMSSGLQVADLVARPIGLHILRPEQQNRAFSALKKKFFCKGGRPRVGEDYDGWGLKIEPSKKKRRASMNSPKPTRRPGTPNPFKDKESKESAVRNRIFHKFQAAPQTRP